jgi:cysteine desulfurase/selenocysteine lyase
MRRIYLDNAATSWPKPDTVYGATDRYQREVGAPVGRSAYDEATEVGRLVTAARRSIARLISAQRPEHIVFTANGTDALNLAIHGSLRPGDHVVTSVIEHNSVLRPLRQLEDMGQITVTRVHCDAAGVVDPYEIRAALQANTRLVALVHASNVTGAIQPIAEVGRIAREHDALFLVDAAQSLGHTPISVAEAKIDFLAAPGHKGLLGPLGTGLLYVREGIEDRVNSVRQGGTGSRSEEDRQPAMLPDKFEAGNLNAVGIVGLLAGIEWLAQRGLDHVRRHETELTARLIAGLRDISSVQIHGPADAQRQVGVVSLSVEGYDPQEMAAALDAAARVQTRAGLHCAPLMHRALGTLQRGGTVRFSVGPFNTTEDIDAALAAVRELSSVH